MAQPLDLAPSRPRDYYVERNLEVDDFTKWLADLEPATRLRSVLGPPGSGKSTFLRALADQLEEDGVPFLWLNAAHTLDGPTLGAWLMEQLRALEAGGKVTLDTQDAELGGRAPQQFHYVLAAMVAALGPNGLALFVDGFDEMTPQGRELVEKHVLQPFLFAEGKNTRAVIARRDEHALVEAVLRWEDEPCPLKGLGVQEGEPAVQVRKRLEDVQGRPAAEARTRLEWPNAPPAAIAFVVALDEPGREDLVIALAPHLTPNPYVNLLLLQRQLLHPNDPLDAADFRACLDGYLTRAGTAVSDAGQLLAIAARLDDPSNFSLKAYLNPTSAREIGQLIEAGIVAQLSGTSRYQFEPAVVQLLGYLREAGEAPDRTQ